MNYPYGNVGLSYLSCGGDLPTPLVGSPDQKPYGHPCLDVFLFGGNPRIKTSLRGGDFPTLPYGHPCLEKVLHLGKPLFPHFSLRGGDFLCPAEK
jgi:hypothetical protein